MRNTWKVLNSIRPFYKARAPVRLRLPVTQESTKSLKALLVLHAKTFELTTKYYASDYFKVNRFIMNVNRYYIVYFSVKSFYPHF